MAEIIFIYNEIKTTLLCDINNKMEDIIKKFLIKIGENEIHNFIFIYLGKKLDIKLKFKEVANELDKTRKKMNLLVIKNNFDEDKDKNKKSNDIICSICNKNKKSSTFNNIFYICNTCDKNICPLCILIHDKNHIIMNYDDNNYILINDNCLKQIKLPTTYTKIFKKLKGKNLFLVEDKIYKLKKKYFLKIIEGINETERNEIITKIKLFNLDFLEETQNNKILLYIYMEIKEENNNIIDLESVFDGNIFPLNEKDIWLIFIKLIIEINFIKGKNIEYNYLNLNQIFIDNKQNVIINLIDISLSKNTDNINKESYDDIDEIKEDNTNIINDIKENPINNISISNDEDFDEVKIMKNKQKKFISNLGIILLKLSLFANKKTIKEIQSIFELNSSQIREYLKFIKDEPLKKFLFQILDNNDKIDSMDELISEKNFLKKVVDLKMMEPLINSEKEFNIDFNKFPFFFSCNSCNIVPSMELLDNKNILFRCPKCHILQKENLHNIKNLKSKWIKSYDIKNLITIEQFDFYDILNLYNNIINQKIEYISGNIEYIHTFNFSNEQALDLYKETISNILSIFLQNIQVGKELIFLFILIKNTLEKTKKKNMKGYVRDNQILDSVKNFFTSETEDKNKREKKGINILECRNNSFCYEEKTIESFTDNIFKNAIGEEREKLISFLEFSNNSKAIIRNYIQNSLTKRRGNYSDLEKKKMYLEDTFDFSEALNQYIAFEKIKNKNNFINKENILENFKDYSSILNSNEHGDFILSLFGTFLEMNGTKTYILKKKEEDFNNIELSSIQALFSLGSQRKYEIHFDFGKTRNLEILKDKKIQNEFLNTYKIKIANLLKINVNRIIFKGVKYGTDTVPLVIIDPTVQEEQKIITLRDSLGNVTEIDKKVMIDNLVYSKDILDRKGDRYQGWGINEKRGGEIYIPPLDGWMGIGLKVLDKYENNDWLSCRGIEGEYAIAYYGLNYYLNNNETFIEDLNENISDIRNVFKEKTFISEDDKRSGILGFFRKKCEGGVCLFQDPKYAELSARVFNIQGVEYKILLMCRVNPKKIRQPLRHDKFWILNPIPEEIRPYRILIKRYFNSPLCDNQLKIEINPVEFIINAINSRDTSAFELKENNKFKFEVGYNKSTRTYYSDEYFILRLYSTSFYKPITTYMYNNGEILQEFGLSQDEINSIIYCLQYAIKNNRNVDNNITVYRCVSKKFPANIDVGSQFYFAAFISTSTSKSEAKKFKRNSNQGTLMTIVLQNNGTDENHPNYCFNLGDLSYSPEQKEILLCSHCYFQVTKIKRTEKMDYIDLVCKGYTLDQ